MSEPLRVLHVMSKLKSTGGIGRVVSGGARELARRGSEVHMAGPCLDGPGAPVPGVELHPWPKRRWKFEQLADLVRLQRRIRAHVIHFHSALPHGEVIASVRAMRRSLGSPRLVVSPYTSVRSGYPKQRARLGLRLADAVIANSRWSADCAIAAGARPDRTHVVNAGIEPGPTASREIRDPLVVALGRLVKIKGIDVLVEAFDRAASKRPEWQLAIAGIGPETEALEVRVRAARCSDRMRLCGWVAGDAKRDLLARASIGVVPSLHENFPGSLLEFQAHGLACVASAVGGIPELALGDAALLVPPQDPEALAEALGVLMDDPARREAVGAAARGLTARLTWEATAEGFEAVYRLLGA